MSSEIQQPPVSGKKMSEKTNRREKKENLQPGDLNQYIRLTPVKTWIVLLAFLVFVIGMVVWGLTGTLTVGINAVAVVENESVSVYIPTDQFTRIKEDSILEINGTSAAFGVLPSEPSVLHSEEVLDEYQRSLAGLKEHEEVTVVYRPTGLLDGSYKAEVILERIKPFEFLFGGNKKL